MDQIEMDERVAADGDTFSSNNHRSKPGSIKNASEGIIDSSIEANTANSIDDDYPSIVRRIAIVFGVALALFCVGIDLTIIATAIPRITDQFSGIELIGWYGSSFFLALACFQPFWGKAYQYFSVKYTFILAVFIFEIGSLLAGIAQSSTVLIVGRAITGVGGAGIATGGYAILTVIATPEQRPIYTGFVTTIYSIANVIGPIMGGAFAEHTTWRWCFYDKLMSRKKTCLQQQQCYYVSSQPSSVMSSLTLTVTFNVGAALSLATAQSILDNLLLTNLPRLAPTVDPRAVIQAGATEIHSTFAVEAVPGIIESYLKGLRAVYIMVNALTGASALAAAANKWEKLSIKR
ncbi:MAG: hypothetical protein Q9219_005373 [cf. Caloplaca sp. 3 TL-2023]